MPTMEQTQVAVLGARIQIFWHSSTANEALPHPGNDVRWQHVKKYTLSADYEAHIDGSELPGK